jgi:hypothetical protein
MIRQIRPSSRARRLVPARERTARAGDPASVRLRGRRVPSAQRRSRAGVTYGHWLQTARHELADARARLPSDPAVTVDDVGATVAARQQVYLALARLVELVVGGQPARADIDRNTVDVALWQPGDRATRLYLGLTAAAGLDRRVAPTGAPICRVGRHLASAAQAVAVAGDILASHAPPIRQPRTPEGVAIRAGAGYTAALADIAGLTREMLRVDTGLPGWASASHPLAGDLYARAMVRARWACGGRLAALADRITSDAVDAPSLVHLLDVAPPAGRRTAITDGATAREGLLAARNWMHRNAAEVRITHLASASRLALAISALATPQAPGADWKSWSTVAHAVSKLHGSPAHDDAAGVAADLDSLARWARPDPSRPGHRPGNGHRREAIDNLAAVLPSVAEVLRVAIAKAARHGAFFVTRRSDLERAPRSLVYHAVTRWRVADPNDERIYRVQRALLDASASVLPPRLTSVPSEFTRHASRLARLAFAAPAGTRPGAQPVVRADQAAPSQLPRPNRDSGRHR